MQKNTLILLGAKILLLIPAPLLTFAITYLSLINLADTPVSEIGVSDKVMHMGAYFGLTLLWLLFWIFNYETEAFVKKIVLICGVVIVFGIFIEVLQQVLTEYRELDLLDAVANSIGTILAGAFVWLLKEYLIRLKAEINLFFIKK